MSHRSEMVKCAEDDCYKQTNHHTGLCMNCRTLKCKTCGKRFTFNMRPSEYCFEHRGKPIRQFERYEYLVEGSE